MKRSIEEEQKYLSYGVLEEEREVLISLVSHCKDICNSRYGDGKRGEVLKFYLDKKQNDDKIMVSGIVAYEHENRTFEGYILYVGKSIVFDLKFTRLCDCECKEYNTLDIFKRVKDGYVVSSNYNTELEKEKRKIK